MTRQEIQRQHTKIKKQLNELEKQKERIMLEWEQLRRECKHPNLYTYSAMGELGKACDDCGYAT